MTLYSGIFYNYISLSYYAFTNSTQQHINCFGQSCNKEIDKKKEQRLKFHHPPILFNNNEPTEINVNLHNNNNAFKSENLSYYQS